MNKPSVWLYILVMALFTYLVRVIPFCLIRGKIKSRFLRSFLRYVPGAALSAMSFPAVLSATQSPYSGLLGLIAAMVFAWRGASLPKVATAACIAVFIAELILPV